MNVVLVRLFSLLYNIPLFAFIYRNLCIHFFFNVHLRRLQMVTFTVLQWTFLNISPHSHPWYSLDYILRGGIVGSWGMVSLVFFRTAQLILMGRKIKELLSLCQPQSVTPQCFSNSNVQMNFLGILLKCKFWFYKSGIGGEICNF